MEASRGTRIALPNWTSSLLAWAGIASAPATAMSRHRENRRRFMKSPPDRYAQSEAEVPGFGGQTSVADRKGDWREGSRESSSVGDESLGQPHPSPTRAQTDFERSPIFANLMLSF